MLGELAGEWKLAPGQIGKNFRKRWTSSQSVGGFLDAPNKYNNIVGLITLAHTARC